MSFQCLKRMIPEGKPRCVRIVSKFVCLFACLFVHPLHEKHSRTKPKKKYRNLPFTREMFVCSFVCSPFTPEILSLSQAAASHKSSQRSQQYNILRKRSTDNPLPRKYFGKETEASVSARLSRGPCAFVYIYIYICL